MIAEIMIFDVVCSLHITAMLTNMPFNEDRILIKNISVETIHCTQV